MNRGFAEARGTGIPWDEAAYVETRAKSVDLIANRCTVRGDRDFHRSSLAEATVFLRGPLDGAHVRHTARRGGGRAGGPQTQRRELPRRATAPEHPTIL